VVSFARDIADPVARDQSSAPTGVFDAHVHLFPDRLAAAIWRWFDANAWPIRYQLSADKIDSFLAARGVEAYLALHYAHAPGIAADLNDFILDFAGRHPRCIASATVMPGEDGAEAILDRALGAGARAVKIHCHVQNVSPDSPAMDAVYRQVVAHDAVLVIHCGNEPALPAYQADIDQLCTVDAFDRAMRRFPAMKVVVPHFGMGETAGYLALLARYPNLYLDTAMLLSGFFAGDPGPAIVEEHWQRIIYGTDFPHIPYAWDRDLRTIESARLSDDQRADVLGGNIRRLLGL
jgi:predicted TIM-barrel fold metal-dependent hydrolase